MEKIRGACELFPTKAEAMEQIFTFVILEGKLNVLRALEEFNSKLDVKIYCRVSTST